jgi:hypothetical protein
LACDREFDGLGLARSAGRAEETGRDSEISKGLKFCVGWQEEGPLKGKRLVGGATQGDGEKTITNNPYLVYTQPTNKSDVPGFWEIRDDT